VALSVAEKYVEAFGKLAKEGTSVVVPGNVGDIGSMIATAMSVYGNVGQAQAKSMSQRLLAESDDSASSDPQTDASAGQSKSDVAQSVLEGFERTQRRQ
jgi:hypothetical protein